MEKRRPFRLAAGHLRTRLCDCVVGQVFIRDSLLYGKKVVGKILRKDECSVKVLWLRHRPIQGRYYAGTTEELASGMEVLIRK